MCWSPVCKEKKHVSHTVSFEHFFDFLNFTTWDKKKLNRSYYFTYIEYFSIINFPFSGILVQLIVTHAEECPYEDLLTLNNEKGKDYAVVNPELFPGAYNFFPELPTRVDEDPWKQFFVYYVGNDTVCWLNVVVKSKKLIFNVYFHIFTFFFIIFFIIWRNVHK